MTWESIFRGLLDIASGRFSIQLLIVSTSLLFLFVVLLGLYMLAFRAYEGARLRRREARAALYRPAVEMVLMEEPLEKVRNALRPRLKTDMPVIQDIIVETMRNLEGPPLEILRQVCEDLGFVDRNLAGLKAFGTRNRAIALESLGVMRAHRAIPAMVETLQRETHLDMKLIALRALASTQDAEALPAFIAQSSELPTPLLPRLASLMLAFGAPGRKALSELVERRPDAFPPSVLKDILLQVAEQEAAS